MTSGPEKKFKSAIKRLKREVEMIGVRRRVKRNAKGKGRDEDSGISTSKDTPTSKRQDGVLTTRENKKMYREKERALNKYKREKKREEIKSNLKEKFKKVASPIGEKIEDFKTNRAAARYKKGKGPRGERATESGSATDEQVCGPDGKCTTGKSGMTLRRGKNRN